MDQPISDEEILQISGVVVRAPVDHLYLKLGVKLGQTLASLEQILESKHNDYLRSTVAILMKWRDVPDSSGSSQRSRLAEIFSSFGLQTVSDKLLSGESMKSVEIPEPMAGLTDDVLKEIADSLETDDQMESLARALGCTRAQINQCHTANRLTGSVTTRGTIDLLTTWKATVQPENQMSSMRSAMTSAKLLYLRDTVLLKAEKQQECQRNQLQQLQQQVKLQQQQQVKLQQQLLNRKSESDQDFLTSMNSVEGDHAFSSLHSIINSTTENQDHTASQTEELKQERVSPCQPNNNSSKDSSHGQQKYYDIYLVYSEKKEHAHVSKVTDIIKRNDWTMTTAADSRLGIPKMTSIQDALETCSHVILILTKDDCKKNDPYRTMTIEMAFPSSTDGIVDGRVISIRCDCEENCLPKCLGSLTNASIDDANLEESLKRSIDVGIRKRREGSSSVGNNRTPPNEGAIAPSVTFDPGQPLRSFTSTPAQVASEIEQLIPRIKDMPSGDSGPCRLWNIQGNIYNIGSVHFTGTPDGMLPACPMIIPAKVRHELSKRLNYSSVTLNDWTELASALGLDDYIDGLTHKTDPTADVIGLAERQEKLCSLEDLRRILVKMKRDDCVEVLDDYQKNGASGETINQLMIEDKDGDGSSSDDS